MRNRWPQFTSSNVEQMVAYRLYLMQLCPHSKPDRMPRIKVEIALVDAFIAEACRSKFLILVVEDDLMMAKTLVAALRTRGYEAFSTPDPWDAVALYAELRPDLAIVDISLDNVNGTELAKELSQWVPSTKLLLISGYAEANDGGVILGPGSAQMSRLERPLSPKELLACVRDLLAPPEVSSGQAPGQPPAAA